MSTLVETISDTLTRLGAVTQGRLRDIVDELCGLNLSAEDHLSVLATALAAVAVTHHARHKPVYLEAVRTWAVEISVGLSPPPARPSLPCGDAPIEEGAEILINGLEGMLEALASGPAKLQDRLVLELALFSRLLGQHEVNAVHLTMMAVGDAIGDDEYRPGYAVRVPLDEMAAPLGRDACLATVAPRGVA